MTTKELTEKTIKDIIRRRSQAVNEFYGYQRERSAKKKRKWNVTVGGYRW